MIILWTILSIIGLIVTIWYFSSVFNPYGRANYPISLRMSTGHVFSWILIIIGFISLIMLYYSIQDSTSFIKFIGGILIVLLIIKNKLAPMEMPFNDVMGSLYTYHGFRFGNFPTSDFLEATDPLEKKVPGIRDEIIGEAHYSARWLHKSPEIYFFFGIVSFESLWIASLLFVVGFIFELANFYIFGPSRFRSKLSRFWNWIKVPLFIISAIKLWPEDIFLSIALIAFLIIQGWLDVVIFPLSFIARLIIYRKYGDRHWDDIEGTAMNFVINRWRLKLFPADRFNVDK